MFVLCVGMIGASVVTREKKITSESLDNAESIHFARNSYPKQFLISFGACHNHDLWKNNFKKLSYFLNEERNNIVCAIKQIFYDKKSS